MGEWERDEMRWSGWLTQAQSGDEAAYGLLLTELSTVIRGYVISKFGLLDNVDDCVQEALLALHQARHTYDARRPFRPWLFAIVRNRTIDVLRQSRKEHLTRDGIADEPAAVREVDDLPLDAGKLLGALSENLRETLVLTKIMGYTTRECAARQGVSESVVKVRVYRGLRKLRALCELETV